MIVKKVVDGVTLNFRNSDCVTTRVDYVKSINSAVCGKHAVSNFGARVWQN